MDGVRLCFVLLIFAIFPLACALCIWLSNRAGKAAKSQRVSKLDTRREPCKRLDLFGRERPFMEVILPPEGRVLTIGLPTKRETDAFAAIGTLLEKLARLAPTEEDVSQLYSVTLHILRGNLERVSLDYDWISREMTMDDCVDLLTAYMEFLESQLNSKN